jgi:hypothetical protein
VETLPEYTGSGKIAGSNIIIILTRTFSGGIAHVANPVTNPQHALPLTVVCKTREQANAVNSIQDVVWAHEHLTNSDDFINALLQTDEVNGVLRNHSKFYGVLYGNIPTGIYLDQ